MTPRSAWTGLTGRLETRLLLVLLATVAGLAGFAALAGEMREGETGWIDRAVLLALRVPGHLETPVGPAWLHESARDVSALGGSTIHALIAILAVPLLVFHRRRREAVVFAASVIFAEGASEALKRLFDRPRPEIVPHLDLVTSSSFPSGHAMMSPVVYLTLAALLASQEREGAGKVLLIGVAALLVVAIGASRVYLGVHWPTDVLGGWILGCIIALAAAWLHGGRTPVQQSPRA